MPEDGDFELLLHDAAQHERGDEQRNGGSGLTEGTQVEVLQRTCVTKTIEKIE